MWNNFKDMPKALRMITGCALTGIGMLFLSVNPYTSFELDGHEVTYAVWWTSGAGPYTSLLGIVWALSAYLLLKRSKHARVACLISLSAVVIAPYLYWVQFLPAALGALQVMLLAWYLYRSESVRTYFASGRAQLA